MRKPSLVAGVEKSVASGLALKICISAMSVLQLSVLSSDLEADQIGLFFTVTIVFSLFSLAELSAGTILLSEGLAASRDGLASKVKTAVFSVLAINTVVLVALLLSFIALKDLYAPIRLLGENFAVIGIQFALLGSIVWLDSVARLVFRIYWLIGQGSISNSFEAIRFLAIFLGLFVLNYFDKLTLWNALFIYFTAPLMTSIFAILRLIRFQIQKHIVELKLSDYSNFHSYFGHFTYQFLIALIGLLGGKIDGLLLPIVLSPQKIAIFILTWKFFGIVPNALEALMLPIWTKLGRLESTEGRMKQWELFKSYMAIVSIGSILLNFVILLSFSWVSHLLFPNLNLDSIDHSFLILMALLSILFSFNGAISTALKAFLLSRNNYIGTFGQSITTTVLVLALSGSFGIYAIPIAHIAVTSILVIPIGIFSIKRHLFSQNI